MQALIMDQALVHGKRALVFYSYEGQPSGVML